MNTASASSEAKQFRRATIYARIVRISLVVLIISFIMFMLLSVPTARAQGAAIQVASLRAALPEYACRRPQYLQSSTTSCLPIHAAKIPNRSCRAMEKRCHSRMMLGELWLSVRTCFRCRDKAPVPHDALPRGSPALAVVINAIVDALAELGVRHIEMPATPERVWRAIREANGRRQVSASARLAACHWRLARHRRRPPTGCLPPPRLARCSIAQTRRPL